ncbi:LytTR family DNA-binding domain-containing protein [Paraflavitalea speifideaquila]|uniref:LytR/AlgR family response regulator transcription factor n=1 Tax=Paraflavitalea speifideaquila TaxID=3076558 RepID=UPI0028E9789D|nr:LytTR family DNA-binding domain-containing protein [Paraflavitalea speifideiaquila]
MQKAKEFAELRDASSPASLPSWIFVRSEKRIEKVELKDILYIESLGNYVNIYTDNKRIMAYLTLKGLESQLPAAAFLKIHQSFLVNCSRIEAIEGNTVLIKDKIIPVSRNYRDALMGLVDQRLLKR